MSKIYVASSWRNPFQPLVVSLLRYESHEVYDFRHPSDQDKGFAWSDIDPDWESWTTEEYVEALNHPVAIKGYANDYSAMEWADTFVLVLPCGRSAHLELGWAVGKGKRTAIYTPSRMEPELMVKMCDFITASSIKLVEWLGK